MKELKINAPGHTIYMMVGPTRCGKSTFSKALGEALSKYGRVSLLSSDTIRAELLGIPEPDCSTGEMESVSEQAFRLLFARLEAVTSFPVNHEYVILDTTGLNQVFREQVQAIAKKNYYHLQVVAFDYKAGDYYVNYPEDKGFYKAVIAQQVRRFKTEFMPSVKRKHYDGFIRVTGTDWKLEVIPGQCLAEAPLSMGTEEVMVIIGDTHENVKALNDMVEKIKTDFSEDFGITFILLGDYIDKGRQTKEMMEYLAKFTKEERVFIVHANHENYVVKRLLGEIEENKELEEKYMTSMAYFLDPANKDHAEQLIEMWEESSPFIQIKRGDHRPVFVTHAPCREAVLGKFKESAKREQRNCANTFRDDPDADYRKHFEFIFEEASHNKPIHVFGHIAHCSPQVNFKNKWFLDTGAVYGHKLSALVIGPHWEKLVQIPTMCLDDNKRNFYDFVTKPIHNEREFSIDNYDLSEDDRKFVNKMFKSKVKYISGTMAPAPSTETELEPMSAALEHYHAAGVEEVLLEPKYMGSRCQIYLDKANPENDFAVSRNGFYIKREGIEKVISDYREKFITYTKDQCIPWNTVIVDGELMPWHFLGEGLITHEFGPYVELVKSELEVLSLDTELAKLKFSEGLLLDQRKVMLKSFEDQLDLYGQNVEPWFNGFSMLEIDGKEVVTTMDTLTSYTTASLGNIMAVALVNLKAWKENASVQEAVAGYYSNVTTVDRMEGVVVKPMKFDPKVAPYMKVRNEGYLHLIYGYDYKLKYEKMCKTKKVFSKMRTSIREHDLALKMLTAEPGSNERLEAIVKMVGELNSEKTLDPRL